LSLALSACEPFSYVLFYMGYFLNYFIQHCFICRHSDSTLLEDSGVKPRTVAILHWQPHALTTPLNLILLLYFTSVLFCTSFRSSYNKYLSQLCLRFTRNETLVTFLDRVPIPTPYTRKPLSLRLSYIYILVKNISLH
jgi:hypothetical protein